MFVHIVFIRLIVFSLIFYELKRKIEKKMTRTTNFSYLSFVDFLPFIGSLLLSFYCCRAVVFVNFVLSYFHGKIIWKFSLRTEYWQ